MQRTQRIELMGSLNDAHQLIALGKLFLRRDHSPFRLRMACAGRIWICVKPLVQLASRSCSTSSGVNEVFSTTVSSTVKSWSPTESAPQRSEILAGIMLEMKMPAGCMPSRLKSEDSGMKLLNTKPICSSIDLSISIRSGPSENSTVCITDTSYSIVRLQNGALWPHFRICCASDSDLWMSEIWSWEVKNVKMFETCHHLRYRHAELCRLAWCGWFCTPARKHERLSR